jgi:hypothetical protein
MLAYIKKWRAVMPKKNLVQSILVKWLNALTGHKPCHEYANHARISGKKTAWQTAAIEKQLSSQNQ